MKRSYKHNPSLVENSKDLRNNMTPEEKQLWYHFLKRLPLTVKRQEIFKHYILDFYISKYKIAIELDGRQHKFLDHKEADTERDAELSMNGIKVLRYTNKAVNENFNGVCLDILKNLNLTVDDLREI